MIQEQAKEIVAKHVKAMAMELVEVVAVEALKQAAAKSENKVDDMVVAALAEPLKLALKDLIVKA